MTDDELVRRYEVLRLTAGALLEATPTDPPPSAAYRRSLDALAQALDGGALQTTAAREIRSCGGVRHGRLSRGGREKSISVV